MKRIVIAFKIIDTAADHDILLLLQSAKFTPTCIFSTWGDADVP